MTLNGFIRLRMRKVHVKRLIRPDKQDWVAIGCV